jgi:hypothetical protein
MVLQRKNYGKKSIEIEQRCRDVVAVPKKEIECARVFENDVR